MKLPIATTQHLSYRNQSAKETRLQEEYQEMNDLPDLSSEDHLPPGTHVSKYNTFVFIWAKLYLLDQILTQILIYCINLGWRVIVKDKKEYFILLRDSSHDALTVHHFKLNFSFCSRDYLPQRNCHSKCSRAWLLFRINCNIRENNLWTTICQHVLSAGFKLPEGIQLTLKWSSLLLTFYHPSTHPFIHWFIWMLFATI